MPCCPRHSAFLCPFLCEGSIPWHWQCQSTMENGHARKISEEKSCSCWNQAFPEEVPLVWNNVAQ